MSRGALSASSSQAAGSSPRLHRSVASCSTVALVLAGTCSVAAGRDSDDRSEEVLVTGQRISESSLKDLDVSGSRLGIRAFDVPATVNAITGDMIELRGITNFVDAVGRAVSVAAMPATTNSSTGFAARGFGGSSVTVLYDGTKSLINIGSMTYPYDTWNVERIEVLSGPASVLYGGGAIGAAINVISRKPSDTPSHTVRVGAGSFNTYRAALDSTGPLIEDKLAYRFDVSHNSSDGFVQRGESSGTVVSGALKYQATDDLALTLSADYGDREPWIYEGTPLIDGRIQPALRRVNYTTSDGEVSFDDSRITLLADWAPSEAFKVTSSTYFLYGQRLWYYGNQYVYQAATDQVLRAGFRRSWQRQYQTGNHTEAVWKQRWFGLENITSFGFDLANVRNTRYFDNYTGSDLVDVRNSDPGRFPNSSINSTRQRSNADQVAWFAEDRLVLTDSLAVLGGVRVENVEIERVDLLNDSSASQTYDPVSWRVGAVYEVMPQLNVYAQYSTAFDPLGTLCCISAAQLQFDMSDGKQSEIGVKQIAWDGRLEWTVAGYRIVKTKLLMPDPNNIGWSIQVGQQSSRGVEASLSLKPVPQVLIELNGTVLEAEYDDFYETVSGVAVSRIDNRPINIPHRMANAFVTWQFLPQLQAHAGLEYRGGFYANTANTQRVPGYQLYSAGLRWSINDSMLLDVRGQNLSDEIHAVNTVNDGSGGGMWVLGASRSFEAALTMRF